VATFVLVTTVGPQPRPARSTRVNLAVLLTVKLLPAFLTRLIDLSDAQSACRAVRFARVNEHTPAHRRSAWATRGLASHRIAKDGRHDPDKHSLRHCHAMLRDLIGERALFIIPGAARRH